VSLFVLDASVALAWFVDTNQAIHGGRDESCRAGPVDLGNDERSCMSERRGKLTPEQTDRGLRQLGIIMASGIQIGAELASLREHPATARAFELTAYDAVYLALARREGFDLATLDKKPRAGAAKAGVALLK